MGTIQNVSDKSFKTETWEIIQKKLEKGNTFIEKGLYNELKELKILFENSVKKIKIL